MSLLVDIQKTYPSFKLDVSFEAGNETLGLLGASGGGKSLTLRCIAGLEKPDKGKIVVAGRTFFDSEKGINLTPQQRKTALLFQNYMLFPNLTVAQNIAAGISKDASKAEIHKIVSDQLKRFDLEGFGKRYPIRLSGGQQQRVALARMLAAKPDILALDEPFSALDSHLKSSLEQGLMDLFDEFKGTIVYVSHDIDEAFRFCDRIAVIDNGSLQQIATTDEILHHPTTYATLKVSGAKNISKAKKLGDYKVEALEWGIKLKTAEIVPDNVAYLAVRASYIEAVGLAASTKKQTTNPLDENCFDFKIERIVDSRFERNVILKPAPDKEATLQWRFNMVDHDTSLDLKKNGYARVFIPPTRIHLVCN